MAKKNGEPKRYLVEGFGIKSQARYVKVKANNQRVCPEWHAGAGEKTWLFCDEIVIE